MLIANANGRGDHKPQAYGVVYYNSDGARKEVHTGTCIFYADTHTEARKETRGQIYESADRGTQSTSATRLGMSQLKGAQIPSLPVLLSYSAVGLSTASVSPR